MIHPFVDGNGRVGHLLIQQLLRRLLALTSPVPVSVVWAEDTDGYVQGLRDYQGGDVDAWLELFSLSVVRAVGSMSEISNRITRLISEFQDRIETRGESVTVRLIDALPEHPIVDSQAVAAWYGVTPQSAHAALVRLEEAGVLSERAFARRRKGRPRRVFAAVELIDLLA